MTYQVEWDPECFGQLDTIVASGVTIEALKYMVRLVEAELSINPLTKGNALSEGLYDFDVLAIRVYFHVDDARRVVTIDGMRLIEL